MRYWEPPTRRAKKRKRAAAPRRGITAGGTFRQYPFLRKFYQHQAVISVGIQKFLFFLVIATLLYVFVFGEAGAIRIMSLRNEKAQVEQTLVALDSDIESLRREIERLKNDPFAMEKLGREHYGYVYPGDRVYKIVHPAK